MLFFLVFLFCCDGAYSKFSCFFFYAGPVFTDRTKFRIFFFLIFFLVLNLDSFVKLYGVRNKPERAVPNAWPNDCAGYLYFNIPQYHIPKPGFCIFLKHPEIAAVRMGVHWFYFNIPQYHIPKPGFCIFFKTPGDSGGTHVSALVLF